MSASAEGVGQLSHLPRAEAVDQLQALVVEEIRTALALSPDEEVSARASFVDELGLSSLRLMEIKGRLEGRLACEISANVLFNRPTVDDLVAYLAELCGFGPAAPAEPSPSRAPRARREAKALVDDLLGGSSRSEDSPRRNA